MKKNWDSFAEDLSRLFREAHASARESLRAKPAEAKKLVLQESLGEIIWKQDKVRAYSKHEAKSRKSSYREKVLI